jgi:hypothetical protein
MKNSMHKHSYIHSYLLNLKIDTQGLNSFYFFTNKISVLLLLPVPSIMLNLAIAAPK